jgi:single-stranded DNA-binding protein
MKNEVYLNGKVKRFSEHGNYWQAWVVVPRGGDREGTTSVLVVSYGGLPWGGRVEVGEKVEIVGHLGWRRRGRDGDEFEMVVIADDMRVLSRGGRKARRWDEEDDEGNGRKAKRRDEDDDEGNGRKAKRRDEDDDEGNGRKAKRRDEDDDEDIPF